jgi:hypothetical protein
MIDWYSVGFGALWFLELAFFCLGRVGGVSAVGERLLWAVLALMFALQTWQARKMINA